jgi:xanthine dehydrogenase small subunit
VQFHLNGLAVEVEPSGTLLDALREQCGITSTKDGCSPQGQCGCCTVWVDGAPRVACVTPVARVKDRAVTTLEGLETAPQWADCFFAHGASQCGFCTPGIIMRLAAMEPTHLAEPAQVHRVLKSHLCRCTGWTPILEAAHAMADGQPIDITALSSPRAVRRASLEGRSSQMLGPQVALGGGGFACDMAPAAARYAVASSPLDQVSQISEPGEWHLTENLTAWRAALGSAPGRRSSLGVSWPIAPVAGPGLLVRELQTTWVEPAYVEPDCSWCEPGGEPASTHANGGAFGGKQDSGLPALVAALAHEHDGPVRAQFTREQVVQWGPKRPPMAISVTVDDEIVEGAVSATSYAVWIRVARTAGVVDALLSLPLPSEVRCEIEEVDVLGPITSVAIRGSGWVELAVVLSSLRTAPTNDPEAVVTDLVTSPEGARAEAWWDSHGHLQLRVDCGVDPADPGEMLVLRSYCMGAVHMALGWVQSEGIAVDDQGQPRDLTLRSLGIATSAQMPQVHLEVVDHGIRAQGPPAVNGSDAVFAVAAAAFWRRSQWAPRWPIQH